MKLKKILAVTIGATLALSTALALTACGDDNSPKALGTTTLSIDNYVEQLDDASALYNSKSSPSTITKINEDGETLVSSYSTAFRIFRKGDTSDNYTYRVYGVNSGKTLESNLTTQPTASTLNGLPYYAFATGEGSELKVTVKLQDGTTLLPADKYSGTPSATSAEFYINNESEKSTVYTVKVDKYVNDTDTQEVIKYFRENVDEKTGVVTYSAVEASALNYQPNGDYAVGTYDTPYSPVYESTDEKPVEGDIADYSYLDVMNGIKFYKANELTAEVTFEYGNALGIVGNYLYYNVLTPVSPDATTGYNYVEYSESRYYAVSVLKYNYQLFKYDIVANKTTELHYNVMITDMESHYNYETKSYDAATIECLKMTNDLFIDNGNADTFTYFTDADLNVAYDLTNKVGLPSYKISDGKYLVRGNYNNGDSIVDENLDIVTSNSYTDKTYYGDSVTVFSVSGKLGLKNLDGKILAAPVYDNIGVFYDGYALATKTVSGESKTVLLSKTGSESAYPETNETNNFYVQNLSYYIPGLYYTATGTEDADSGRISYTIAVKNYAGTTVKTFNNVSGYTLSVSGNIITVRTYSEGVTVTDYYAVK